MNAIKFKNSPVTKLRKKSRHCYPKFTCLTNLKITNLLRFIGMPDNQIGEIKAASQGTIGGSFWTRHEGNWEYLYKDAEAQYKKRMLEVHPDRGGSNEEALELNLAWAAIKKRFESRINPRMFIPGNTSK